MPRNDPRFWEVPFDPEVLQGLPEEPRTDEEPSERKSHLRSRAIEDIRELIGSRLTDRQRQIVDLYFFQGRTQQDIAEALGITQQVVNKHLFGVIRNGKRVGGAIAKLRHAASEEGIDPSKWV